ncbi:MAG TPA: LTA synthase family protein [Planctomycetota bacterium]|nr:LTA synthase family protein [Planctomycetota bacterium]
MSTPPESLRQVFRDRIRLVLSLLAVSVFLGLALRPILYARFHGHEFHAAALARCLAMGVVMDVLVGLVALAPLAILLATFRLPWLAKRGPRLGLLFVACSAQAFLLFLEYFFFEEFNARFNHIAVDYVLFPREVFGNIGESYNVPLFVACSLGIGALLTSICERAVRGATFGPLRPLQRVQGFCFSVAVAGISLYGAAALPAQTSHDRVESEVAQNGLAQLLRAYLTAELDYTAYYRTLPKPEARARAAAVLGFPMLSAQQIAEPEQRFELQKDFVPATGSPPLDVVVVIEESLGSEFIGSLPGDAAEKCTPHFDRWAREGLLLTNLTANGNRTVRGLEGVLASFVPLPGDSIVVRARSENVATLARVFAARGYATCFLYGGYGVFDNMKPFMRANGWSEFVEQPDFPDDAFRTTWGVADEYVFDALLERQKQNAARGEPFFGTLMSTSNHKPYRTPEGRVPRGPGSKPGRLDAVRYSDWCLGRYLDAARDAGLLAHTLVLVVGDHGARVYGSEEIPTPSYRIPALFLTPGVQWRGQRIERVCSQIDLAPTLLALAGISARAPFLGESLLGQPSDGGRAFVQHNRDVGILTDTSLVVLGLQKSVYYYARSGRDSDQLTRIEPAHATPQMLELEKDLAAVFQTAYEIYQNRNYRLPPSGPQ